MKRYLITGGCGSLATPLVKTLLQQGHAVSTFDNYSRGSRSRLNGQDVCFFYGDICDYNVVKTAVKGHDAVIHLAAINGTKNFYDYPSRVLEVGTKGIINVMDACVEHGVGELLIASSSEVYQTPPVYPAHEEVPLTIPYPQNPRYSYAASKIISEMFALHYKSEDFNKMLIIRPHNCYGPDAGWDHVIPQLIREVSNPRTAKKIQGSGKETRAFCYVDDAVSGILTILEKGEHRNIYNVGTDEVVSMESLLLRIALIMNKPVREIIHTQSPSGSTPYRCPNISKLKALGWEPKVMLEEGLRKTILWYLEHPLERKEC